MLTSMATRTSKLLDLDVLQKAGECLRTISHPVRLRMIQMLLQGDHTVRDLASACGVPRHVASEHLRLMQHCGLMVSRREGRYTYYEITEPHLKDIMRCIVSRFGNGKA